MDAAAIRERLSQKKGPRFARWWSRPTPRSRTWRPSRPAAWSSPEASVDSVPLRAYPLGQGAAHVPGPGGGDHGAAARVRGLRGDRARGDGGAGGGGGGAQPAAHGKGRPAPRGGQQPRRGGRGGGAPVPGGGAQREPDPGHDAADRPWRRRWAGRPGSAVALDPRNGEILAMVSLPSYDPNEFAKGIEPAAWSGRQQGSLDPSHESGDPGTVLAGQHASRSDVAGRPAGGRDHARRRSSTAPATSTSTTPRSAATRSRGTEPSTCAGRSRCRATCTSTTWECGWASSASPATPGSSAWPCPRAWTCPPR